MGTYQPGLQASRKHSQGVAASRGLSSLDQLGHVPLPFHITNGQPAIGQGVVKHVVGNWCGFESS
ncbi:unnamed protein product [Spirodela intermedia]|uniref:Uncharacterized protein n=1 Tax=Spirodela intermedia TaxID=51605 RepID=A0A7I8KIV8_SPIIN|nr:unnamed protein product [Spirodela intermedia]